jgi:hypothetical protein
MRLLSLVVISGVVAACQRPVEVRGLYVNDHGPGNFLPCDQPKTIVLVQDSALVARYRVTATQPYQPVFVRLRGVPVDSGSIYGGQHYFLVQRILEVRPRQSGECPGASPALPISPTGLPNKRLKLAGGDRSDGSEVLCAGAHERSFNHGCARGRVARSLSAVR